MTLAEKLKLHTKADHDRLEHLMHADKIFNNDFTLAEYRRMLLTAWRFHHQFEPAVFAALQHMPGLELPQRSKLSALEEDIASLQTPLPSVSQDNNIVFSPQEAIAYLYLMEGATLGGNVIRKQLQNMPGLEGFSFGYHYFYGAATGASWKKFIDIINALPEAWHEEILAAAKKGYDNYSLLINSFSLKNSLIEH